jgi:chemotaxis protein CheZ
MSLNAVPLIGLKQAELLVELLRSGDITAANKLVANAHNKETEDMFAEIGKMTRQLHDSLNNFQLDARIANLANEEIPNAQERLNYVINLTEQAANTTMDAIEAGMPLADKLCHEVSSIKPTWDKLMTRKLKVGEFKVLCHKVNNFIADAEQDTAQMHILLNEVLMAQGFQDLTGQVIRRVIDLVREVEDSLIHLLTVFGTSEPDEMAAEEQKDQAEGPIINADEREDVVSDQDDVDDLLSSLGF